MAREGVVCAGAWCVDRNTVIDHWPDEETVVKIISMERQGGCSSHNMATALRRLGAAFPIEAIGLIGDDEDGRLLAGICDAHTIDRRKLVLRPGAATPFTHVMISQATGKRTFFYAAGTHDLQTPDDFDFTGTAARLLHLGMPGVHLTLDAPWQGEASGWLPVLRKAKAAGLKTNVELVSIEPERLRAIVEPILPYLDTLIVNDLEAGAVAGIETVRQGVTDAEACRQAGARLLERSNLELVAIHFPLGGIVMGRDGARFERPSVRVPPAEVRSSNGAGDAFAAGILYGLHESWPLGRALTLAHAAAATSLRAGSTTGAIAPWQECLALADRWGWREA
jgi:sugar/nucleoside kinase (ribokinase family)